MALQTNFVHIKTPNNIEHWMRAILFISLPQI